MGALSRLRVIEGTGGEQEGHRSSGRPSDYDPSFCEIAEYTLAQGPGFSIISVCVAIDIALSTFQEWQKRHPEFRAAIQRGRLKGIFVGEKHFNDVCLRGGMNSVQLNALRLGLQNRVRALEDEMMRAEWLNPDEDVQRKNAEDDSPDMSALTDEELEQLSNLSAKLQAKAANLG